MARSKVAVLLQGQCFCHLSGYSGLIYYILRKIFTALSDCRNLFSKRAHHITVTVFYMLKIAGVAVRQTYWLSVLRLSSAVPN